MLRSEMGACSTIIVPLNNTTDIAGFTFEFAPLKYIDDTIEVEFGYTVLRNIIDEDFSGARSVYAEDIDGNGDMDVLGAGDDGIAWWDLDNLFVRSREPRSIRIDD